MYSEINLKEYLALEYINENPELLRKYDYLFKGILRHDDLAILIRGKTISNRIKFNEKQVLLEDTFINGAYQVIFHIFDPFNNVDNKEIYRNDQNVLEVYLDSNELYNLIKYQLNNLIPKTKKITKSFKKSSLKLGIMYCAVMVIFFPIVLNFSLFRFSTGQTAGELADWMTFFSSIIGGIGGGFFTFLAIHYTERKQKEQKKHLDINFLSYYTYFLKEKTMSLLNDMDQINQKIMVLDDKKYYVFAAQFKVWKIDLIKDAEEILKFCERNTEKLSTLENNTYTLNLRIFNAFTHINDWFKSMSADDKDDFKVNWAPNFSGEGISKVIADIIKDLQLIETEYDITSIEIWNSYFADGNFPHIKG